MSNGVSDFRATSGATAQTTIDSAETFKFIWEIRGISLERILQAKANETLASPSFSALSHNWHLDVNFNADGGNGGKCLGIGVTLDTPDVTVPITFKISCGRFSNSRTSVLSTVTPRPAGSFRGSGNNIPHSAISAAKFLSDGVLTIEATLRSSADMIATAGPVQQLSLSAPAVAPPSLASDVGRIISGAARGCPFDVTLLCSDGQRVPAHALILALRSSVFAALFARDSGLAPVDRDAGVPVPPEITSATLRRALEFIYSDELTPTSAEEARREHEKRVFLDVV